MTDSRPIRVIIVDDHAMLRRGLAFFLKGFDDLEMVGEAGSGREAIALVDEVQPDVVLMDMKMPDIDGAEATRIIRQRFPEVQVIILTSFQEEDLIERALQTGAIGYLLKNITAGELAEAVRSAYAGRPTLAPEATEVLMQTSRRRTDLGYMSLTKRQEQMLDLLAEGLSNAQIAERLMLSVSTVKYHLRGLYAALGVSKRGEAATLAWKMARSKSESEDADAPG